MSEWLIEQLLKLGFREYIPSRLEECDRAWQLTLNEEDEPTKFINVNWHDMSKVGRDESLPEVELYIEHEKFVEKRLFYGFFSEEDIISIIIKTLSV